MADETIISTPDQLVSLWSRLGYGSGHTIRPEDAERLEMPIGVGSMTCREVSEWVEEPERHRMASAAVRLLAEEQCRQQREASEDLLRPPLTAAEFAARGEGREEAVRLIMEQLAPPINAMIDARMKRWVETLDSVVSHALPLSNVAEIMELPEGETINYDDLKIAQEMDDERRNAAQVAHDLGGEKERG